MNEYLLAAAAAAPKSYLWLKWAHVLGVIVYAGGLLTLTRVLGRVTRFKSAASRNDAYITFRRMHVFVDWGGLALLLATGLWILIADPEGKAYLTKPYFHTKLTAVVVLLACDAVLSVRLFRLRAGGPQPSRNFFRILHGVAGLALMGALLAVFVLRG